jgi:hypothetical protein
VIPAGLVLLLLAALLERRRRRQRWLEASFVEQLAAWEQRSPAIERPVRLPPVKPLRAQRAPPATEHLRRVR